MHSLLQVHMLFQIYHMSRRLWSHLAITVADRLVLYTKHWIEIPDSSPRINDLYIKIKLNVQNRNPFYIVSELHSYFSIWWEVKWFNWHAWRHCSYRSYLWHHPGMAQHSGYQLISESCELDYNIYRYWRPRPLGRGSNACRCCSLARILTDVNSTH